MQGQTLVVKKANTQGGFGPIALKHRELLGMLREHGDTLLSDLKRLESVSLNPFLEIGSAGAHRSLALLNSYPVNGVASDISEGALQDATYISSALGYPRVPYLICCDACHLPFLPNTFQFVFTYQTIHRFENPCPVVTECYRVLGRGGHFFFNEEPMDSSLRRFLRGGRMLSDPPTRLQRIGAGLHLEKVFWDDGRADREHGIVVSRFDLGQWRRALAPFGEAVLEVNRYLKIRVDLRKAQVTPAIASAIGGNVKGLALKTEGEATGSDFVNRLLCLDCGSASLIVKDHTVACPICGRCYPIMNNILRMLPKELETDLYSREAFER